MSVNHRSGCSASWLCIKDFSNDELGPACPVRALPVAHIPGLLPSPRKCLLFFWKWGRQKVTSDCGGARERIGGKLCSYAATAMARSSKVSNRYDHAAQATDVIRIRAL